MSRIFEVRIYDEGRPVRRTAYPVQAVRFGKNLTLVALGGEGEISAQRAGGLSG